jgi:DNA-binding NtrC family response regulator
MSAAAKILLIEDDSGIADTLRRVLAEEGHEVAVERGATMVWRGRGAIRSIWSSPICACRACRPGIGAPIARRPTAPADHSATAFGTTETAIEATKFGAYDYLLKPSTCRA